MNVLMKFISDEPIENVITCMNYKLDRVVIFGQFSQIERQRKNLESFLKEKCNVTSVAFRVLANYDFDSIENEIRKGIDFEMEKGGKCFFDITGGEALMVTAFSMIAKEYYAPIHIYNVRAKKLVEVNEGAVREISSDLEPQKIRYNLDMMVRLYGGAINYYFRKDINDDPLKGDNKVELETMWKVSKRCGENWNSMCEIFRNCLEPDEDLNVKYSTDDICRGMKRIGGRIRTLEQLNEYMDYFAEYGIILDLKTTEESISFRYKNRNLKEYLWMGGSALELHVYKKERQVSEDCKVGVHLDWDGELHYTIGVDVLNEIDVLSLNGYIPKFISCKSGILNSKTVLRALYELDVVAGRFGGKYAKKVLVTTEEIGPIYQDRAAEMGIELVVEKE